MILLWQRLYLSRCSRYYRDIVRTSQRQRSHPTNNLWCTHVSRSDKKSTGGIFINRGGGTEPADRNPQRTRQFCSNRERADRSRQYAGAILSTGDEYRMNEMLRILQLHQIEHSFTQERFSSSGKTYPAGSLVVPYDQAQYRLAKSMFESRKDFVEDVFYDVSTWNMGFAMDFTMQQISQRQLRSLTLGEMDKPAARIDLTRAIAVAIDWKNMGSAKALSLLLQQGITTVAVTKPTALVTDEGAKQLSLGSIIVPLEADATERKNTLQKVVSIAGQAKVELIPIESGLASAGVDMGSPSIIPVPRVRPLLIIGDGVRSYDAGEVCTF